MKKSVIFFVTVVISLLAYNNACSKEKVRLATGEWPPFISKRLKHHGVVMRIIKESFAVEGITVEYQFFLGTEQKN